jgi:hypothetical protein
MLRRFSGVPIRKVIGNIGKAKILYSYTPGGSICQISPPIISPCPYYSNIDGGGPITTQTIIINGGGPNTVQQCSINGGVSNTCPSYSNINGGSPNSIQSIDVNGGGPNTVQQCSINGG